MGFLGLFGPNIKRMEKKEDIEGLTQALKHDKHDIREKAAAALDRLSWKPEHKVERAWFLLGQSAWQKLVDLGEPAIQPLIKSLTHPEEKTRKAAAKSLEQVSISFPNSSVPLLCDAICGPLIGTDMIKIEAQNHIVKLLANIGDPRAVVPLIKSYVALSKVDVSSSQKMEHRNKTSEYWKLIKHAIKEIGNPAVDPLIDLLQEKDEEKPNKIRFMQGMVALALGALGSSAVDPLLNLYDNNDEYVRRHAIKALSQIDDDRAINTLVIALQDKDKIVRVSAVARLIELNWQPENSEQKAYFLLASMLRASSPSVGTSFEAKLEQLVGMGEVAIGPMIQSLDLEGLVSTRMGKQDTTVPAKKAVIKVLSKIGEPALDPLWQVVNDQNQSEEAQDAARQAMKIIHQD